MRRAAWIFLASILLPSLGLAWLAIRSAQDQQIVLEHQQVIISQNITDALAKDLQARMDEIRADFVKNTQQLLDTSASAFELADNFNPRLTHAWPLAEIGFAVNVDGVIYSPKVYDGPAAQTFRDENGRFLSNRENIEVYASKLQTWTAQDGAAAGAASPVAKAIAPASQDLLTTSVPPPTHADKDEAQLDSLRPVAKKQNLASSESRDVSIAATNTQLSSGAGFLSDTKAEAGLKEPAGGSKQEEYRAAAQPATAATITMPAPPTAPAATSSPVTQQMANAAGQSAHDELQSSPAVPGNQPQSQLSGDFGQTSRADAASLSVSSSNYIQKTQRNVVPQQMLARESAAISNSVPEESDFRRVIGTEASGELARFLENKLRLMVWSHAPAESPIVFGAQLSSAKVVDTLRASFQIPALAPDNFSSPGRSETCVAILDDTGHPVARSIPNFQTDWKHPFVATEIGDVLPHWEAALYLVDPQQFSRAAQTLRATIALIVLVLVAVIVAGGSLIAADVRRQVRLAQQKTDFVSNVSHELKTPLTSIRMFADLLAEKRVPDEERQATYLRIIAAEAARLTRLINNVLDFARLERGKSIGEPRPCDLVEAVRDVVETCAPHLEAAGVAFHHEVETESLPIRGDIDALAQIILNLISNAEKYGGDDILVRVRRQETAAGPLGCVDVLDRGAGIPSGEVRTVFEPFHRLDDSLATGIPGSGLGLTLARRMARGHGGDVTYSARAGGGSCFTLTVPLDASA